MRNRDRNAQPNRYRVELEAGSGERIADRRRNPLRFYAFHSTETYADAGIKLPVYPSSGKARVRMLAPSTRCTGILARHRDKLGKNRRMEMSYRTWDRQSSEDQAATRTQGERFLAALQFA